MSPAGYIERKCRVLTEIINIMVAEFDVINEACTMMEILYRSYVTLEVGYMGQ